MFENPNSSYLKFLETVKLETQAFEIPLYIYIYVYRFK